MPSSSYRITEPHPSVPSSRYLYSGRGGAGNISHVDPTSLTSGKSAAGPASLANLSSGAIAARNYTSGRGGAGNLHASERPIFSFDEELERQRRMMEHQAPVYHIGRGGAGNYAAPVEKAARRPSSGSSGSDSDHQGPRTSGTWQRFRDSLSK